MKGTNNAYLTINWVYRYIFYLLVCLLVCVSYMEWQLKTWKINQQLLPHQTDTTREETVYAVIFQHSLELVSVSVPHRYTQIHTHSHSMYIHTYHHPYTLLRPPHYPPHIDIIYSP